MTQLRKYSAIIERDGDWYVALCPVLDVASQGKSVSEARSNLQEAIELFLESASESEVEERMSGEIYVTSVEVTVG